MRGSLCKQLRLLLQQKTMNKTAQSEDFIVIDVVWENQRRIKKQQLPLSRNAKKVPVEFTNEPDNLVNNLVAGRPQFESSRPLLERPQDVVSRKWDPFWLHFGSVFGVF
mgnify:CR=1 FL=1